MNLSYHASLDFCMSNLDQLNALAHSAKIVLCPSFVALSSITEILKNSPITTGAQNCSEHSSGSFTGEISAESLSQVGATYCIVGHSERRIYFGETTDTIIKKIHLLHEHNIHPIICIGETKEQFEQRATFTILAEQLKPIIDAMQHQHTYTIAYEPVWSIGTGIVPENNYLEEVFDWIAKCVHAHAPHHATQLLYGGSINSKNIHQLKTVKGIDGFLIGSASTDFDEFKKIVIE